MSASKEVLEGRSKATEALACAEEVEVEVGQKGAAEEAPQSWAGEAQPKWAEEVAWIEGPSGAASRASGEQRGYRTRHGTLSS